MNIFNREMAAHPVGLLRLIIGTATIFTLVEVFLLLAKLTRPGIIHLPYVAGLPQIESTHLTVLIPMALTTALLFAVGWHTRLAGATLVAGIAYILLYDQQLYSNHLYLLGLLIFLLTIGDSGAKLSLDAIRDRARVRAGKRVESAEQSRTERSPRATVKAWPLLLIKVQISVVYFFAAVSKLTPAYLAGNVLATVLPMDALANPLLIAWVPILLPVLAYVSIGVELFIALALWFPRWRWAALLAGIALHGLIILTMGWPQPLLILQLTVFAITIMAPYLLFFVDTRNSEI